MDHLNESDRLTPELAHNWLELALKNIQQEYPFTGLLYAQGPDDLRPHRQDHPTFFGSLDWHSCVEMYWVAVRLMRMYPGLIGEAHAIAVIDELLTEENIAAELAFCQKRASFERPYGWGWLHKLQAELDLWDADHAKRWSEILSPLSDWFRERYAEWLPKLTYPQRIGMHTNTAFALWLSLPHITERDPHLQALVMERAAEWFGQDIAYPFAYEPSGADFLSAGLCEAVLMRWLFSPEAFQAWITGFLPQGGDWLTPATVSDMSDGQLAHLHGLNLSRAWALGELAAVLPERADELRSMREAHIAASIDAVSGTHYMVEHWLVAYALLLYTEPVELTLPTETTSG